MPRYDAVDSRCDGERIEVLMICDGQVVTVEISPERALRLAHDLAGHALLMLDRRSVQTSAQTKSPAG